MASGELEQEELIRRARAGDEQALTELLAEHGPIVRRQLAIPDRWRSVLDVDEVMQGAYYKAFLGIAAFEPRGQKAFQRWLSILARNGLRDELKALSAQKRGGGFRRVEPGRDDDSLVALYQRVAITSGTPSLSAGRAEIGVAVRTAISILDERHREIVRLRDIDGLTFDRIAERVKKSATVVRGLHREACERLREILETASKFTSGPG